MNGFRTILQQRTALVEDYLAGLFTAEVPYKKLLESMRYSLMAGGKRLRPVLCMSFCEAAGGQAEDALPAAAAIELVHTFSLIHDDLPCMDDSDLRRGRPTNHKIYGEALATLAGDALQTAAFRLLAQMDAPADRIVRCVELLAVAAGEDGMGAGQTLDLLNCSGPLTDAELRFINNRKTGDMIRASCQMGAVLGGGTPAQVEAAGEYGLELGLAFQIRDDMLDCTASDAELGKSTGKDEENGRSTFVTLLGLEGCRQEVERLTESAVSHLQTAGFPDTAFAEELAWTLSERKR